ncbi:MAG: FAD-binding oxidoreductase [Candidatus Thorarchaeota archaeon]
MKLKNFEIIYNENRFKIEEIEKIQIKLNEIVGSKNVSADEIDLLAYSTALLISLNWSLQGKIPGLPDLIVWPENKFQISEILKLANTEKIPVIPYGEGSGAVGGTIPLQGGIILDMKKFNKILNINDKNLTVTAESGINGMNLERYLNAKGYTCGHIPQSLYMSSLGGWIAHKAAGQFSTKYGKIEDIVLGMEMILPQGEIINFKPIVRASTGPQLDKFFIGNEGTLGIVTEATLKIWPYPEARALISYVFPSIEDSFNATREILREHIFPAVIRIYDQFETERHFPEIEKAKDKVMVVFVCEGNQKLVNLEEEVTKEKCEKNNGVSCGPHPVEHWFETRFRVTETSTMPPYKIVFDTLEIASSWDNATKIYHSVIDSMNDLKGVVMITAHISHFYPNGVGVYFSFGGVPDKGISDLSFYQKCWDTTIKAVLNAGGSIAHHHGIGINRSHWMDDEWGKSMQIMRRIKDLLDPNNILNPGKVYTNIWKGSEQ